MTQPMTPGQVDQARQAMVRLFELIGHLPRVPLLAAEVPPLGVTATWRTRAIESRAALRYPCALCVIAQSRAALILGPSDLVGPAAWLDVCARCYQALRVLGDAIDGGYLDDHTRWPPATGDAAILTRYDTWRKEHAQ